MEKQIPEEKQTTQKQEKKQQKQEQKNENYLDDDALDDILNQNKLNITDEGDDGDDIFDPKVQQEYEKLMKDMMGGEGGFGSMMENLLSSINPNQNKGQGNNQSNQKQDEQFKSKMNDILKGLEGGNLEDVANKLLNQFMDKQILQQPLQQTKKAYQQIFSNPEKVKATQDDLQRYRKQYFVVKDILAQLKKDPNDKQALIKKFEQMQLHGSPPEGINVSM